MCEINTEYKNSHIRFDTLHSALSYALQKTLSKLTLKTFVSCYPAIDRSSLEYVRQQIIKSWQTRAELEFQKIFAERNLKEKLDSLDDVISSGEQRKNLFINEVKHNDYNPKINIRSLSPSELAKTYIITEKEKSLEILKSELENIKNTNEELLLKMQELRNEINNDIDDYKSIVDDLKTLDDLDNEGEENSFKDIIKWAIGEITNSE